MAQYNSMYMHCTICLDELDDNSIEIEFCNCQVLYHMKCLQKWYIYKQQKICPICRTISLEISQSPIISSPFVSILTVREINPIFSVILIIIIYVYIYMLIFE